MVTNTPTTMPKQMSAPTYTSSLWTGKRFYIIAFLFFNMFINYMDRINLSVAAPTISKMFKWDSATMGWIFSCYLFTYMIFLIPWGRLTDRFGSRNVGTVSMVLWSLGGMATGATWGSQACWLPGWGWVSEKRLRSPSAARSCGSGSRPASVAWPRPSSMPAPSPAPRSRLRFVAWLVLQTGWRMSFVITGAIGILWAILWYAFFRAPAECTWLPEDERNYLLAQTGAPAQRGRCATGPDQGRPRPVAQPQDHVGTVHYPGMLRLYDVPVPRLAALLPGA